MGRAMEVTCKSFFLALQPTQDARGELVITRSQVEAFGESIKDGTWQPADGDDDKSEGFTAKDNELTAETLAEITLRAWSIMDVDANGAITFPEFYHGILFLIAADESPAARAEFWFRALDINNDGAITEDELLHWVKMMQKAGGLPPKHALTKGNAFQGPRPATAEEVARKWMRTYDVDRSHGISRREFDAMTRDIDFTSVFSSLTETDVEGGKHSVWEFVFEPFIELNDTFKKEEEAKLKEFEKQPAGQKEEDRKQWLEKMGTGGDEGSEKDR